MKLVRFVYHFAEKTCDQIGLTCDLDIEQTDEMALESLSSKGVFEGREFNVVYTQMENAVLLYLWEGSRPLLGTLSVSLPGGISTKLLGEKNALLGQVIGEMISSFFKKMAVVSIHMRGSEDEQVARLVMGLVRDLTARSSTRESSHSNDLRRNHV